MKSVKAEKAEKSAPRRIHENELEDDQICLRGNKIFPYRSLGLRSSSFLRLKPSPFQLCIL